MSKPARKTFRRLSKIQEEVFGNIAVGLDKGHPPRTLKSLLEADLIQERREKLPGFPPMTISRYEVPLHIHVEWCVWCSQQEDNDDDAGDGDADQSKHSTDG